jgi:ParB family chromosome partitioning protein
MQGSAVDGLSGCLAMRMPWVPAKPDRNPALKPGQADFFNADPVTTGEPLLASVDLLDEDPANPRTEFPERELQELADDIGARGILQPIVVHRAGADGRYRIRFGAKRLRAAKQAGLSEVPIVVGLGDHDAYAQVAENQKRHGLTPLDLARFMRSQVEAGESNAEIGKRMGIDQTTVAHHLALLSLPPVLDDALKSGRCTSPRTLYELSKLHEVQPEQVAALASSDVQLTRTAVAALKSNDFAPAAPGRQRTGTRRSSSLIDQANACCSRLESLLARLSKPKAATADELAELRRRLTALGDR